MVRMGSHSKWAALGAILALLGTALVTSGKMLARREGEGDFQPPTEPPDVDFVVNKGVRHGTHQHDGKPDIHRGGMEMKMLEEERELMELRAYIARMRSDPSLLPPDPADFPSIPIRGGSIKALEKAVEQAEEDLAGPQARATGRQDPALLTLQSILNGDSTALGRRQAGDVSTEEKEEGRERQRRLIEKDPMRRWTKGIVPYIFMMNDTKTIRGIRVAMNKVEYYSCIRFVPYEGAETKTKYGLDHDGYLKFTSGSGCYATQGNVRNSNGQGISCCGWETCVHELGHALGLAHEHMNEFRDDFLYVNFDGVQDNYKVWYTKSLVGQFDSADIFDVTNTMSYGSGAFSKPGQKTMRLLEENERFGNGHFYYFKNIVEGHDCKALKCPTFTKTCANDGFVSFVNGECVCMCPPGLDPDTGCTSVKGEKSLNVQWPRGQYGLLRTMDGCPGEAGEFLTGTVVEHSEPGNWVRSSYHLGGITSSKNTLHFCMMNNTTPATSSTGQWSPGRYCIYRYGGTCPEGFSNAYAQFDDVIPEGQSNTQEGAYPDGVYGNNTRYEFCCRGDGFDDFPIQIPGNKNMALYRMDYWQACPTIPGMFGDQEFYTFNSADTEGLNPGFYGDIKPLGMTWSNHFYYIYYCYYQPKFTDCGAYYELSDANSEVTFTSPNYPNPYPERAECHYFVKGPKDSTLVLTFEDFTLDSYCKDKVAMRLNNPGELATSFCGGGGKLEGSFHSVRNFISLDFTSDSVLSAKGFKARVRMVKDSELCYSKADKGASYRGTKNYTRTFQACLPWAQVSHCRASLYGLSDGEHGLEENYCRNPGFGLRPWCYVTAETCDRAYCDVCDLDLPQDRLDDCAALKASGECDADPLLALTGCALTCATSLPPEFPSLPMSEVHCDPPPAVPHATVQEAAKASYNVGDKVTYKCNDGFETVSSSCLTTGYWSPVKYVCGSCPDGWLYSEEYCYGFEKEIANSPQAAAKCASYNGGILTPLKTKAELAVVEKLRMLREEFRVVLIGLNDTVTEGSFYWSDGTPASNINWGPKQPDNYWNAEDCTALQGDSTVNDVYCSSRSSYVCRTPLRLTAKNSATSTLICTDRREDCEYLFEVDPAFCRDNKSFSIINCRETCGFCDTSTSSSSCTAPTLAANSGAEMVTTSPTVGLGETFRMACKTGNVLTSGNLVRGCSIDGTLTGSNPVCTDINNVDTKVNQLEMFARGSNGEANHLYVGTSPYLSISRVGKLTSWTFHSTKSRKMVLQVWRPSTTTTGQFILVGHTNVTTKADRVNVVKLAAADAISVLSGDIIGLWFGAGTEGGVTFDVCDATSRPEGQPIYKVNVAEADLYKTTSVTFPSTAICHVFSLTATISPST